MPARIIIAAGARLTPETRRELRQLGATHIFDTPDPVLLFRHIATALKERLSPTKPRPDPTPEELLEESFIYGSDR